MLRSKLGIAVFIILNAFIPLLTGILIYLTSRNRTVLYDIFCRIGIRLNTVDQPSFLRNYGCDFCWAYSLFWITLGWGLICRWNNAALAAGLITFPFAAAVEFLQIPSSFPGHFDLFDIIVEFSAIGISALMAVWAEKKGAVYEKSH